MAYSFYPPIGPFTNVDISSTAAIALNKLAALTPSKALVSDALGVLSASTVTAAELAYLSGVTSAVQTQINAKAPLAGPTFTGNVTGTFIGNLTGNASTATTATNFSGAVTESQVTNLVSDLALKSPLASPTFTGVVTSPSFVGPLTGLASSATTSAALTGNIPESQVTNLVSDLALKSPIASPTFTGIVTAPSFVGPLTGLASSATTSAALTGNIPESQVTNLVADLALKAPLAGPTFTGTVVGTFSGNLTGNVTGNVSGTAASITGNLTGDVTSSGMATSLAAAIVTGKLITGFLSGAGTVAATDSLLAALNKLDGNIALKANLAGPTFTGTTSGTFSGPLTGNVTGNVSGTSATFTGSLTGDVTSTAMATTIAANAVTNAKAAQMATNTLKGNNTGSTANALDLTAAQATAILSAFVGDSGAGGTKGLVPAPATGDGAALKVLLANGTWGTAGTASPLTTKGDLYGFSTVNARIPVGADGTVLIPDSLATLGARYETRSAGRKNYITYNNFENNSTTGWSVLGCATVTNGLPVTVGGSNLAFSTINGGRAKNANTNAIALDSSSALSGVYAVNLATTGAGAIGDGIISQSYTIDKSDQAKVLSFKFNYKVASGTPALPGTLANTYAVAIYDLANNSWIIPAGCFNITQSSGVGTAQGTFQTASNTTGIQIFIYSPVAPTSTSSFLIDDVYIGPQSLAFGPAMSDWIAYTPTGGWTSNATYTGFYRRVGDSIQIQATISLSGAPNATNATIVLPTGLTIDTAKLPNLGNSTTALGTWAGIRTGVSFYIGTVVYSSTNSVIFNHPASGFNLDATHPATWASGDFIGIQFQVPIAGWSSNTVMSNDTDTRVVAFRSTGQPTGTINTSPNVIKFPAASIDTHGGYSASTGAYTCPMSGYYSVSSSIRYDGSSSANPYSEVHIRKNGTDVLFSNQDDAGMTVSHQTMVATGIIQCNVGDTIDITSVCTLTGANYVNANLHYFNIMRLSGPAVVAASESVNARYYASSTTISGSLATVVWTTKDFDSHSGMVSGSYTVPIGGKFQVNTAMRIAATFANTNNITIDICKNGTGVAEGLFVIQSAIGSQSVNISDIVNCVAGDTISVKVLATGTSPSVVSSNTENYISIARVGN